MMIHANKKHIDKIDIDDELIKIIDDKIKKCNFTDSKEYCKNIAL